MKNCCARINRRNAVIAGFMLIASIPSSLGIFVYKDLTSMVSNKCCLIMSSVIFPVCLKRRLCLECKKEGTSQVLAGNDQQTQKFSRCGN